MQMATWTKGITADTDAVGKLAGVLLQQCVNAKGTIGFCFDYRLLYVWRERLIHTMDFRSSVNMIFFYGLIGKTNFSIIDLGSIWVFGGLFIPRWKLRILNSDQNRRRLLNLD